jgi:hypothetical protein
MFKRTTTLSLTLGLLLIAGTVAANQPINITYKSRGSNDDGDFSKYSVSCTDGSSRTISAWNERKQWCIGTSKTQCTNDQLKTAKKACSMPQDNK